MYNIYLSLSAAVIVSLYGKTSDWGNETGLKISDVVAHQNFDKKQVDTLILFCNLKFVDYDQIERTVLPSLTPMWVIWVKRYCNMWSMAMMFRVTRQ